jgi:hypothetical protein
VRPSETWNARGLRNRSQVLAALKTPRSRMRSSTAAFLRAGIGLVRALADVPLANARAANSSGEDATFR